MTSIRSILERRFVIELEDKMYACWLDTVYWISSDEKYKLLNTAGNVREIYNMSEKQMEALVGQKSAERIKQQKMRYEPDKVWNYVTGLGISYTYCGENAFPAKLTVIPDPPFGIFYKGSLPKDDVPSVAMIGARRCSEYGQYMAENFASGLAQSGINIISGMALGIDGISQKAAIKAGGKTYGVLGCGVDVIYPKSNEKLYNQLLEKGGILSEYPPGMEPRPALFPPRNRIISGLADVVLVIEAREKSGTSITVDMALEQGKDVYAVPGRCTDSLSQGCNKLLRQGALVATSPEDIINDMHWSTPVYKQKDSSKKPSSGLSQGALEIYGLLEVTPKTQDTLIMKLREQKSSLSMTQICQALVELELKGFTVRENGQYRLSKF
jgi:DNA processing protein